MSRSKGFLILVFLLGGFTALTLARRELAEEKLDPSVRAAREVGAIQMALERYRIDTGGYPSSHEGLDALIHRPYILSSAIWHGPYIHWKGDRFVDPWGRPYRYRVMSSGRGVAYTLGADDEPGGTGENQDLWGAPEAAHDESSG
jgi:general secretion pathway protein G